MLRRLIATLAILTCLFSSIAHAVTHPSTTVKSRSIFGTTLYVYNYSSTPVRVTERYTSPFDVFPNGGYYSLDTDWFDNLYDVGFYYLTAFGTYYPVPNCYFGNLYHDYSVTIRDAYIDGYWVPACSSF